MTAIDDLRDLIGTFEDVYAETGAGAETNLTNPETGDASDVVLRYMRRGDESGLYVKIGEGHAMRLVEAPPAIMARAAFHLPELSQALDAAAAQIELEVVRGTDALSKWLESRGVLEQGGTRG